MSLSNNIDADPVLDFESADNPVRTKIFYNNNYLSSLLVQKPRDNRPFIQVLVHDVPVVALIDSGACRSFLGKPCLKLLNKFKIKVHAADISSVNTASGEPVHILGYAFLPLNIDGKPLVIEVLVSDQITSPLILGADFLNRFETKLNFKEQRFSFKKVTGEANTDIDDTSVYSMSGGVCSKLSTKEEDVLNMVVDKFKELDRPELGCTDRFMHVIDTGDAAPIKQRHYSLSPYMHNIMKEKIEEMLRLQVIEPSNSPWASPVVLVKKGSGEYRFCFDGRRLNEVTKKDAYPLPKVDGILNRLRDAKYISSIDLKSAFWQIPLHPNSREKTAFVVPSFGLFQFKRMPFGLNNAAQSQQRLMDNVIPPTLEPNVFVYLDDIIICNKTFEEHIRTLTEVFERLRDANLTINFAKCQFCRPSLKYLGFVVDQGGLRTNPEKVAAMINYPIPRTATEVKRFLGLCSWYRRFISHFSSIVAPLNALLSGKRKKQQIEWNQEADKAFIKIKEALTSAPVLVSPDFSRKFVIQCDASDVGVGAVLTQTLEDDEEHVIAFASRSLSKAERVYTTTEKELLAVLYAVDKFRPYVEGTSFQVITDHHSLVWLKNLKDPTGRLARWALKLSQYDLELIHRKGKFHLVPDALSRIPVVEKDIEGFKPEVTVLSGEDVGECTNGNFVHSDRLDFSTVDNWYAKMVQNVRNDPSKYPKFQVKEGRLFKFVPNKSPVCSNIQEWKLVVPLPQRKIVFELCHDDPTSGHMGFFKTLKKTMSTYYWYNMREDILKYIRTCAVCGAQKAPNVTPAGLMGRPKLVQFPFQVISTDLIGPLPRSTNGNCFLLVVTDWFSKFVLVHPMRQATAKEVVKFLENQVFLLFGIPQIIMVDNGVQFVSNQFKELLKSHGIKYVWYNAKYHAQVNFTERTNRTVETMIRSYLGDNSHKDWDKHIYKIAHAIRSHVHEVTGYSPNFLNFGRVVPSYGDYYGKVGNKEIIAEDRGLRADDLRKLPEIYSEVVKRLDAAYVRNANAYNLRRRDTQFQVGDLVWKRNVVLSDKSKNFASKLAPRYILCSVVVVHSRLVYSLRTISGDDIGRWHIKDLKPYLGEEVLTGP